MVQPKKVSELPSQSPRKVRELDNTAPKKVGEAEQPPAWVQKQKQGLEQPWIDPIDAIAGPLGFGKKIGMKATSKALAGSLASEPVVGGAQAHMSESLEGAPGAVKMPVNFLAGMVMGDLLGVGSKQASRLSKMRPKSGSVSKPQVLRESALEEIAGLDAPPDQSNLPRSTEKPLTQKGLERVGGLYTKYIGSPVWDQMVNKQLPKMLEKVPGGKAVNRALIYDYRGDLPNTQEYMKLREDMERGMGLGAEYAIDLGSRLQKMPEEKQLMLGEYIRGERNELPEDLQGLGDEAKDTLYTLGKEATEAGILDEETFFKNAGKYMPRLYSSKEYNQKLSKYGQRKPERMDLSRFKRRKDIPKEVRKQMGEILTPGYPVAKGISQLGNDIQRAKFFNAIAQNPDWARPQTITKTETDTGAVTKSIEQPQDVPESFKQLPESEKLGKLSGAYVHPEIHRELDDVAQSLTKGQEAWNKALGAWKFGKVILSPKTHMRNVMSNSILAHLGGMPMTSQPQYMAKAAEEMARGGEYWKQAKKHGLLDTSFVQKEMGQLFDQVGQKMKGIEANSLQDSVGAFGKALQGLKGAGRKASDLYQAEEQWFKLGKFMHNIEKKGMDPRDAAEDAEKWLFNYGKLTRFQDKYRRSPFGAPFATFTFKSLPRVAEAATKYPWRFAAPMSVIAGMQEAAQQKVGDTEKQEQAKRELLPEWMQGATPAGPNFARVPVTDKHGREYYLNLSYILPWGDIGEGGEFMGIPGSLRPMSQPFTNELAQQIANYDIFWEEPIVKETETAGKEGLDKLATQVKERGKHLFQTLSPTIIRDIQKGISAQQGVPDYRGRMRPDSVVAADVFGGIKMYPVDYSERVMRLINEKSPDNGRLARQLYGKIETLATKKKTVEEKGNQKLAEYYQNQIEKRVKQLEGLASKTKEIGQTFQRATGGSE
jgi:hypothetical protein